MVQYSTGVLKRGNLRTPERARGGVLWKTYNFTPRGPWKKCGARTRKGIPCRARALPGKARCKFHGGLSTGPKTAEGRMRIAEAQRKRWSHRGTDNVSELRQEEITTM